MFDEMSQTGKKKERNGTTEIFHQNKLLLKIHLVKLKYLGPSWSTELISLGKRQ